MPPGTASRKVPPTAGSGSLIEEVRLLRVDRQRPARRSASLAPRRGPGQATGRGPSVVWHS